MAGRRQEGVSREMPWPGLGGNPELRMLSGNLGRLTLPFHGWEGDVPEANWGVFFGVIISHSIIRDNWGAWANWEF